VNQLDFQTLTSDRTHDAQALLSAGRWSGAYYVLGYAVECALKACILARLTKDAGIIFEEGQRRFSENCWTHDLERLVESAGLRDEREAAFAANERLARNWLFVKDWKEATRYQHKSQSEAKELFDAVTNSPDGVLLWIKTHW
jgi:HEPN domain-containing protein